MNSQLRVFNPLQDRFSDYVGGRGALGRLMLQAPSVVEKSKIARPELAANFYPLCNEKPKNLADFNAATCLIAEEFSPYIPDWLAASTNIEYLLVNQLVLNAAGFLNLPRQLKTLEVFNPDKPVKVPEDVILPELERLFVLPVEIAFKKENFPNLRALGARLDGKGLLLKALSEYQRMPQLHLGGLKSSEQLKELACLDVEVLKIDGGAVESLDGIEVNKKISALWINNLKKLKNIDAISQLPNLELLMIWYCNGIESYEVVFDVKKLTHFQTNGCKHFLGDAFRRRIEERSLLISDIGPDIRS